MSTVHRYLRPSWTCGTCHEPWPCAERKIKFLQDYEGRNHDLRALLALFFIEATEDLTDTIEEIHARFVSWAIPVRR